MVQYFPVITGSLTVNGNLSVSGNVAVTGSMSGTASLAANAELLSGTGSVGFTTTGSFTVASSSLSSRTTQIESVYATTGSNSFRATQSITGSLTVTGQIVAQTLNVQQVTSSIVYSSGSNVFGCDLNSRQTFTGSVLMTGSLIVNTTGPELQVNNNGVILGNLLTDNHSITGSLRITGSLALAGNITGNAITLTGALSGTSATFSGNLNLQGAVTRNINFYDSSNTNINAQIQYDQISSNSGQLFFGTNNAGTFATRLTISNTGAATFVGSATFGSDVFTYANGGIFFNGGGSYGSGIFQQSGGALALQTGTTPRLTIASTGTATFTNSITAPSLYGNSYAQTSTSGTTSFVNTGIFYNTSITGFGNNSIYNLVISGNPNGAGSSEYRSVYLGYITITTGYDFGISSVVQRISYTQVVTGDAYNIGALTISVVFWDGTTETTQQITGTTNNQIRIKITGYNSGNIGAAQTVLITKVN